jgi:hypothetical protein
VRSSTAAGHEVRKDDPVSSRVLRLANTAGHPFGDGRCGRRDSVLPYPRPGARTHGRIAMASRLPRHARSSLTCHPSTPCPPCRSTRAPPPRRVYDLDTALALIAGGDRQEPEKGAGHRR